MNIVKLRNLFFHLILLTILLGTSLSFADDPSSTAPTIDPTTSPNPPDTPEEDERLPDIEAKTFEIRVIRRSKSNRVYLFEDIENRQPTPGHLILLKRETEPVMAFRVLKDYLDDKKIAAKRVKRYGSYKNLEGGEAYLAVEKISDINPALTAQDNADLNELEDKEDLKNRLHVKAYDPELDAPSTPHKPQDDEDSDEDEDGQDSHLAVTVEQVEIIDHNRHWLTAGFGFVRNNGPPGTTTTFLYSAGNARYGLTLGKMVFFDKAHLQDSFAVEGGIYLYKTINFENQGDSYTILAFSGALRYNLMFSETFGLFLYGGIMQNNVIAAVLSASDGLAALNSIQPLAGVGALLEVGPNWYLRTDLGYDSMTLNLVLRF